MDQSEAPILDALVDYRQSNRYGFTPPGHRQGRGTDDRVLDVLGHEPFRDDVLASGGLDDRRTSEQVPEARRGPDGRGRRRRDGVLLDLRQLAVGEGRDDGRRRRRRRVSRLLRRPRQPQVDRRRTDLLRRAAALDHPTLGRRAALLPSAVARAGRRGVGATPRRGRRADRQPEPLRHLHRPRGHRQGVPRPRQAADRRRGVGRAPAVPRGPADVGDGRRRRRLCGQRAQDGRRIRAGLGLPSCRATSSTGTGCRPARTC